MRYWPMLGAVLAVVGYALLSHGLMLHAPGHAWAVVALFGPMLAAITTVAWQRRHGPSLLACAVLLCTLGWVVRHGGVDDLSRLYVLQHAGIHLVFGWVFAMTLRPRSQPIITLVALRIHGSLGQTELHYTRRLTGFWVLYFGTMVVASLTLYAFAPWAWWSSFANLVTPLSLATLLLGEHALRYRLHPEFKRATLRQTMQAWRSAQGARTAPHQPLHP